MARTIATFSGGPSRGALIGEQAGQAFQQAFQDALGQRQQQRQLAELGSPMLEPLQASQSPIAQGLAGSPSMVGQLMQSPQGLQVLQSMTQPAAPEARPFVRVISGDSPLNEMLGLGIPQGEFARVELERMPDGTLQVAGGVQARFGGEGTIINVGAGEREGEVQLARLDADFVKGIQEDAERARTIRTPLAQMRAALDAGAFTPGAFGETRRGLAQIAELVGINPVAIGLGQTADAESMEAASELLAVQVAEQLGRVTNMSLQMARGTVPNLLRTAEGNKLIQEIMERSAVHDIERSRFVDSFLAEHGNFRTPEGRSLRAELMEWDRKNEVRIDDLFDDMERLADQPVRQLSDVLREGAEATRRLPQRVGEVRRMSSSQIEQLVNSLTREQAERLPPEVRAELVRRRREVQE